MGGHGVKAILAAALCTALIAAACSSDGKPELVISGIPDQEVSRLETRFNAMADYLSEALDMDVRYLPSVDYAAVVAGFRRGDIQLGWYGGLTGVQARLAVPGSVAVAQRPRDEEFHSVFIVQSAIEAQSLEDLKGLTFTFGSESSTSGHLMPRFFLTQAGVDPESDFDGLPSYSGSHDKTWKLVEAGSFRAGALNEAVWQRAVSEGSVNLSKVRVLLTTEPYYDYHWALRSNADDLFGDGFTDRLTEALLAINPEDHAELLELFQADAFIGTSNDNYGAIEEVARGLGLVE